MEWRFPAALFTTGAVVSFLAKSNPALCTEHGVGWRFKTNTALDWMETPRYLLYLRLLGAAVAAIGTFATMFLAKRFFESWFI